MTCDDSFRPVACAFSTSRGRSCCELRFAMLVKRFGMAGRGALG